MSPRDEFLSRVRDVATGQPLRPGVMSPEADKDKNRYKNGVDWANLEPWELHGKE